MTLAFAQAVIDWQKQFGRHNLPWQTKLNQAADPYAIWVSEIMLQQTQVTAVIGYFAKFMVRFPTIHALANASQEAVLQSWSGLGYYSRARNLHASAVTIINEFNGAFPRQFDDILSLPGIGRSTAAAISTFAHDMPQPILDGNVKRVFARYFNITGATNTPNVVQTMWQIAERENPTNALDAIIYTQGLMDLGATLCTRSKPRCNDCAMNISCLAYANQSVHLLPTPKPRKKTPKKSTTMLIMLHENKVLLEKRPPNGIWGGLWSLPEIAMHEDATAVALTRFGASAKAEDILTVINHAFTHYKLAIHPQPLQLISKPPQSQHVAIIWLPMNDAINAAIPTPVRKILSLIQHTNQSTHQK